MDPSAGWLDRYRSGDRDAVWQELRELGGGVRAPNVAPEAQAVCDEMAQRARQNVEVIVERLIHQGFAFHTNDNKKMPVSPHHPPGPHVARVLGWLQSSFEALPMTLLSWVRLVGDVWLVGTHPDWPESAAADPLVVEVEGSRYPNESIIEYFEDEKRSFQEDREFSGERLFQLPVAPDRLHKDNVSGGPPYGLILPDACADGMLVAESTMPFVAYLNWVFRHGGFPAPTGSPQQGRITTALALDLLPL